MNHPFVDGNKRTAFLLCEVLLENDDLTINTETDLIYDFVISVANGDLTFEQIVEWLKNNTSSI